MATQTYQSEAELENQLIKQLNEQNYASVEINDYDALLANFREQFCRFNDAKLLVKSSARTATRNKRTWRLSANGSS